MACFEGIEQLPKDDLLEIMILVARQPGGAIDITRAFAACKTFGEFIKDKTVLQAVSFKDLFYQLPRKYEPFSEADGLVARCARAGNPNAQLVLAKIVMVNASKLCAAKVESTRFDGFSKQFSTLTISDVDKAAQFLGHFSAQNTDPSELLHLIRDFLSRGKVRDFVEMHHHLENFAAFYLVPGKAPQFQNFILLLDKLCKSTIPVVGFSNPLTPVIEKFNVICFMGRDLMKNLGIEEAVYSPLVQNLTRISDDVDYETMMERLKIVEPVLKLGGDVAKHLGNRQDFRTIKGFSSTVVILRGQLKQLMYHEAYFESNRGTLLASFEALFSV
ncbi:hypothetical protein vseg_013800 [Gypsophila vaccaria]